MEPMQIRSVDTPKIGFKFRNRSEAQTLVLSSGRVKHPTAGRANQ